MKFIIKMGSGIAGLLMISPLIIFFSYEEINNLVAFIILMLVSISYCAYMLNEFSFTDYLDKEYKLYNKVIKGEHFQSKTETQKLNHYKLICEDIMKKYKEKKKY